MAEQIWYRQVHPTSWVAYRGNQAIAEGTSEKELREKLANLGITAYQHQPLRIVRFGPAPAE